MKCTIADLFRVLVLEQAAELPESPQKDGKAPPPAAQAAQRGARLDPARVNAETTWPLKKLDAAVLAQLQGYRGRGPHSLGPLIE